MTTAARELDAWLAEHLFGHQVTTVDREGYPDGLCEYVLYTMEHPLIHYSTTGDGMLMVIEAMRAKGLHVCIKSNPFTGGYIAQFDRWMAEGMRWHFIRFADGDDIPTAVAGAAKAALSAEEVES